MIAVQHLIDELAAAGVDLYCDGPHLRYRAPQGALTPRLRQHVTRHRAGLIAHLHDHDCAGLPPRVADWPADWREDFEERAAIIEYLGGQRRADAEGEAETLLRDRYSRQFATPPAST